MSDEREEDVRGGKLKSLRGREDFGEGDSWRKERSAFVLVDKDE